MLGTIEELNNDIEKFQKNVAASNELYELLGQLINGVNQQNEQLGNRADTVIRQLDSLPGEIKGSNNQSNADIQQTVQNISDATVASLNEAHQKYISSISQLHDEVKQYVSKVEEVTKAIQELPELLNSTQNKLNKDQQDEINKILESFEQRIAKYQQDFLTELQKTCEALASYQEVMHKLPEVIKDNQRQLNTAQKEEIDHLLTKAEDSMATEQKKYISELQKTREAIDGCQKELKETYDDFLQTLKNTNIAYIHEQNVQLQKTLNQRTTLLTVISLIAVVVSIIGWFI